MDSFRKIDVDKYDEDVLLEEELIDIDPRSSTELAGIAKQKANDVRGLIGRCVGASPAACSLVSSAHTTPVYPIHHSRGDARGALAMILSDPPYGETNAEAKVSVQRRAGAWVGKAWPELSLAMLCHQNTTLMSLLDIINMTKSSDVASLVKSLSLDEQDMLMKYIYKGLASPELGASAVLLGWHEKVSSLAPATRLSQPTDSPLSFTGS